MTDPLEKARESQMTARKGRLKVFLGMAAGVGKTYSMLSEGHQLQEMGVDVVIGYLEPHGREETERLAHGLAAVPVRTLEHKGVSLREMDLDAVLNRKPEAALVDELAHTNSPGSRHAKRWQDVEELLAAGINVYTTVNIQHIESLRDLVAKVTGVFVKETLPDSILEAADEIELIDLPPEQLQQRLREGKVYVPEKIEQALQGFFKRSNLLALRELALRHTAQKVDRDLREESASQVKGEPIHAGERVLVCIAPNAMAPRVVRAAKRLASSQHASLTAVFVESSRQSGLAGAGGEQAEHAMHLAETLGARVVGLAGDDISAEIIRFARQENVSTIVMGKPLRPRWKEILFGSVVDTTIRSSGDIDVLVITGAESAGSPIFRRKPVTPGNFRSYAEAFATVAFCTVVGRVVFLSREHLANMVMLYLLGTVSVALRQGPKESLFASIVSVLALNFFFVPPQFTFAVSDFRYLFTFGVMMGVSLLLSALTLRLRSSAKTISERERSTAVLYELSKRLVECRKKAAMADAAAQCASDLIGRPVVVVVLSDRRVARLDQLVNHPSPPESELAVAQWCIENGKAAGAGTDTLAGSQWLFMPLRGAEKMVGCLAVHMATSTPLESTRQRLLESVADQLAGALERAQFAKESNEALLHAEKEQLRSDLLSSVSHDLRTPLSSIQGSASSMLQETELSNRSRELAETIQTEAHRMARLIENLLDMTKVQGALDLNKDWQSINDLVINAIDRTAKEFDTEVSVRQEPQEILAYVDGVLIEQVLVNLLENAARHAGRAAHVTISVSQSETALRLIIEDDGPGMAPGTEDQIFERFKKSGSRGLGLGLAICKAAVEAHGGTITAENANPGARFEIVLPKEKSRG
ncbi:MAG: sensor histidine kinase KdpD [Armatimonadetes bacterium]|nr:sensor histidine kinase KdpD [Armatimonadota bacterium]